MVADHPPAPPAPHAAADHSPTPPAPLAAHVAAARAAFSPAEDALLADTLAVYGRLTKEAVAAFAIAAAARGFPVRSKSQLYTRCNGKKGPQPQASGR